MDLIGQKQASWALQQSPVREEEGVQKGLLEPPPLSQVDPLLHTLNPPPLPPSMERRKEEDVEGRHEAAECKRVDLNAGKTKAAPGPRPST